ncbi:MAG: tRNA (guanosine(37)-N1)-methyltransferase TrmD [Clostridiales bacterium]|jgi:tRNA (guanine37-N1)-methyltransferase|nr:tRNA (guanosine(37)-N1)-methyltransferase TrmD [Clostridiales bacterium]
MNFKILTLFPDMLKGFVSSSVIGRAIEKGIISVNLTDIRDFTLDKHRRTDDTPYGGGFGMVMTCQPAVDCIRAVKSRLEGSVRTVYLSPQGSLFDHRKAVELSGYDNLILFCGHYEGIDERIIRLEIDEEISIGDYVLTGGELPAAVVTDGVARLIDGVLPDRICHEEESIASGLLEYPQYTKPRVFEGLEVPEILLSGHHANIEKWRKEQAYQRTLEKRPDLLEKLEVDNNAKGT